MSSKSSLLLIIKQNKGLNYNELLAKIASGYTSINSARAALSRSIKDLSAVGLVSRSGNKIYITDKGVHSISGVMKHKLVIKLNSIIKSKEKYSEVDSIVQNLHTLIERSKQDPELFSAAKGSADFSISDLKDIKEKVAVRAQQLDYFSTILEKEITELKSMDFNERVVFAPSDIMLKKVIELATPDKLQDAVVETTGSSDASLLSSKFGSKAKNNSFSIKAGKVFGLYKVMQKNSIDYAKIFLGSVSITFFSGKVVVYGPYSRILPLKKVILQKQK